MRIKTLKWLNSARLGQPLLARSCADPGTILRATFESVRNWVSDWCCRPDAKVALLDSTTAACDAALLALAGETDVYLYMTQSHPSIRQSVRGAAKLAAFIRGRPTVVKEVEFGGFTLASPELLADSIAESIARTSAGRPSVVVLEHVTYKHGLLIPIEGVVERLAKLSPATRVIIDGAQAVGIWRPPPLAISAYLGCFHKYVGALPGTAFLLVDTSLVRRLQPHVGNICDLEGAAAYGVLQTLDLTKWRRTASLLASQDFIATLDKRQSGVARFNAAFDEALFPVVTALGIAHRSKLRSHITSVEFGSEQIASSATEAAMQKGFGVQQLGTLVRITAGHRVRAHWGAEIGAILRAAVQSAQDRPAPAAVSGLSWPDQSTLTAKG